MADVVMIKNLRDDQGKTNKPIAGFRDYWTKLVLFTLVALLINSPCIPAQDTADPVESRSPAGGRELLERTADGSVLGGPNTPDAQLKEDAVRRETPSRLPGMDKLFDRFQNRLLTIKDKYGLQIGADYNALYQHSNRTLTGEKGASSGSVRLLGNWELIGRGTKNPGSLSFILENRHRLWSDVTPAELGGEIGYLGITGLTFSDSGSSLTTLYWGQALAKRRAGFVLGRIDPTDYTDILGYANQRTTFVNLSSTVNPTIAFPDPGFGFGAGGFITDQLFALGVVSDANGSLTDVEFFPDGSEFYKYAEIGWTPSRKERFTTNVHIGGWHADKRKDAQVPESHGVVVSANRTIGDNLMLFARAGWSDGEAPFYNRAVNGGLIHYFSRYKDLAGFSAAWNDPAVADLRDQYTFEVFYRLQVWNDFAITADTQLLLNPALNPDEDQIWVFGLRARLAL